MGRPFAALPNKLLGSEHIRFWAMLYCDWHWVKWILLSFFFFFFLTSGVHFNLRNESCSNCFILTYEMKHVPIPSFSLFYICLLFQLSGLEAFLATNYNTLELILISSGMRKRKHFNSGTRPNNWEWFCNFCSYLSKLFNLCFKTLFKVFLWIGLLIINLKKIL